MSFIDDLLLDKAAYGFQGGPTWDTTIVRLRSGYTKRNANRALPLHRYSAPFNNIEAADWAEVLNAFNACQGGAHSFRFFDRNDYQLSGEIIATGTGASQQVQLTKKYAFGTGSPQTIITRNITKPVDSTVDYGRLTKQLGAAPAFALTEENLTSSPLLPQTSLAFSLDYSTGIVTFTATAGATIRATGWFDVPVRFVNDDLLLTRTALNANSLDVELEEDLGA